MVYDAIKEADPDEKLVQLKSLEALEEVAKGDANKIFIPFEATSTLAGLGAMKEALVDGKGKRGRPKKEDKDKASTNNVEKLANTEMAENNDNNANQ